MLRKERVYTEKDQPIYLDLIERYHFPRHVIGRLINDVQPLIMRPTYIAHAVPVHTQVQHGHTFFIAHEKKPIWPCLIRIV